jgi:hypothetical protein
MPIFAVFLTCGAAWQAECAMEEQDAWRSHADFMNARDDVRFFTP